jgi:hypothetical protein
MVAPLKVGKSIVFVQRFSRKVREMSYNFYVQGYASPNRTKFSEHITFPGVVQMALTREPFEIVWCVLANGQLAAMTHEEEDGQIITGWHRHYIAGGSVESIAVIPSSDGTFDQLWMTVARRINGQTIRTIETMQPYFDQFSNILTAWFVDGGMQYSNGVPFTVVPGLSYLQGATVFAHGDGCYMGSFTVSAAGTITLPYPVTLVTVGFGYTSSAQLLRSDSGSADGTAIGKLRRVHRTSVLLANTLGLAMGSSSSPTQQPIDFRTDSDKTTTPIPPFNGIKEQTIDCDYDYDAMVSFSQGDTNPGTILAVMPKMDTQDAE